jgi:hypothetical protein
MPLETSCMPSFERVNMMYGENGGTPLRQKFHYELIFTWIMSNKSLLLMWWLLIRHGRWWLWMSLVDQPVYLWNLMPLLRSINIESFMKDVTLFRWLWKCTLHLGVIWIVSSRNVFIFSMIDDQEIIYPCLFAFNFSSNVLVLLFNVL